MTISSRTPEGDSNCCSVCGKSVCIEPSSTPNRDAPCPHCGHLLWYQSDPIHLGKQRSPSYDQLVIEFGTRRFGELDLKYERRLVGALDALTHQATLPSRKKTLADIATAASWQEVINRLEAKADPVANKQERPIIEKLLEWFKKT